MFHDESLNPFTLGSKVKVTSNKIIADVGLRDNGTFELCVCCSASLLALSSVGLVLFC